MACAGSGVNKVTDDFGGDINSEFSVRTGTSLPNTGINYNSSAIFTPESQTVMSSA